MQTFGIVDNGVVRDMTAEEIEEASAKNEGKGFTDTQRLDAFESGFSIWQTTFVNDGSTVWNCQYSIEGFVTGKTMREAIDKAIIANDAGTIS